jgi:hypothetical protein
MDNVEQPVGVYEKGVVEKRDRLLEMAFDHPATLLVSSAPEEVRIMTFAPLVQQGCNGQKFIVNETRKRVFFKPTEYLGKSGKRVNIYGVLMAWQSWLYSGPDRCLKKLKNLYWFDKQGGCVSLELSSVTDCELLLFLERVISRIWFLFSRANSSSRFFLMSRDLKALILSIFILKV